MNDGCFERSPTRSAEDHRMELRTPLITAPQGRYQGAPALIPAIRHTFTDMVLEERNGIYR